MGYCLRLSPLAQDDFSLPFSKDDSKPPSPSSPSKLTKENDNTQKASPFYLSRQSGRRGKFATPNLSCVFQCSEKERHLHYSKRTYSFSPILFAQGEGIAYLNNLSISANLAIFPPAALFPPFSRNAVSISFLFCAWISNTLSSMLPSITKRQTVVGRF